MTTNYSIMVETGNLVEVSPYNVTSGIAMDLSGTWFPVGIKGFDVIPTANLPAAGVANHGRIIIEDAGAGDRNIIIYVGTERFRIDGGAGF